MNDDALQDCIHEAISAVNASMKQDATSVASFRSLETDILAIEYPEEFMCPICHGLLFRPILAACSHRFCRFCLTLWSEKCTANGQNRVCPMCRDAIDCTETLPLDDALEKRILAEVGMEKYKSRHRDLVLEKVERLMVDLDVEHKMEVEESYFDTLQFGARVGIVGTAFAGPLGAVAALGAVGAYAAYLQLLRLKREGRRKYGIIEDDATLSDLPKGCIRVSNLTLTLVHIELYNQENMLYPLVSHPISPREVFTFCAYLFTDIIGNRVTEFALRVVSPGLLGKELATMSAAIDHGYLFCCTDACVEEVSRFDVNEHVRKKVVEITNDSSMTVRCSFYTTSTYFSDDDITLEPGATYMILLTGGFSSSTVQISVANDSFIAATELCNVQMRSRYRYRIVESRYMREIGEGGKEHEFGDSLLEFDFDHLFGFE